MQETINILKVGFIGAGGINFGSPEGPWNHSLRLEKLSKQYKIQVVAIVDINTNLAKARLKEKLSDMYVNCAIFDNFKDMISSDHCPNAVFIGLPPDQHGSFGCDIELQCAANNISMFIDKPISVASIKEIYDFKNKLQSIINNNKIIVSVGYMLRYNSVIEKAKEILNSFINEKKCEFNGCIRHSGGPIVEQATHFIDLLRYFGGEVDLESIQIQKIPYVSFPFLEDMQKMDPFLNEGEHNVPDEYKINRVTTSSFKFKKDENLNPCETIGILTHTFLLHKAKFMTEFEIICDGLRILISDPYNDPKLYVRFPNSEADHLIEVENTDMYFNEINAFVSAVLSGNNNIKSSYSDAVLTYELSKRISC